MVNAELAPTAIIESTVADANARAWDYFDRSVSIYAITSSISVRVSARSGIAPCGFDRKVRS